MSLDGWRTQEFSSICAVEYYAASKREAVLTPATAQVYLEDIILSEMRWSQKDKSYIYESASVRI